MRAASTSCIVEVDQLSDEEDATAAFVRESCMHGVLACRPHALVSLGIDHGWRSNGARTLMAGASIRWLLARRGTERQRLTRGQGTWLFVKRVHRVAHSMGITATQSAAAATTITTQWQDALKGLIAIWANHVTKAHREEGTCRP